jgi:hypothetical protein
LYSFAKLEMSHIFFEKMKKKIKKIAEPGTEQSPWSPGVLLELGFSPEMKGGYLESQI